MCTQMECKKQFFLEMISFKMVPDQSEIFKRRWLMGTMYTTWHAEVSFYWSLGTYILSVFLKACITLGETLTTTNV